MVQPVTLPNGGVNYVGERFGNLTRPVTRKIIGLRVNNSTVGPIVIDP